ncbi:hypothetical protein ILUMI_20181, partial [Ignelater luminosus]
MVVRRDKEGRRLSREKDKLNYVNHLSRNLTNMKYREDIQSHWKALREGMKKLWSNVEVRGEVLRETGLMKILYKNKDGELEGSEDEIPR